MSQQTADLGKLKRIHTVAPAYVQRAAIVAILSFIFFLAMMTGVYVRQNFVYFLLATAFLAVNIFTMFGWLMMRKNLVKIYENGLTYKKIAARWDEIENISEINKKGFEICKTNGEKIFISANIYEFEQIHQSAKSLSLSN